MGEEQEKMSNSEKLEKFVLRKAFDDPHDPYLPDHILWRQKEQFSDGVGYSWIDSLKERSEQIITSEDWSNRDKLWPKDTPDSKEAIWYRKMFDQLFNNPKSQDTVERWIPRSDWGCPTDPSGRAQKVHNSSY